MTPRSTAPAARASEPAPPDPRPVVVETPAGAAVAGWRCVECSYPVAEEAPRCPSCGGVLREEAFPGTGVVWSATRLHVDVQGRPAPYTLCYVDLEDGPRVLAHAAAADGSELRAAVGDTVGVAGVTGRGDVRVEPAGGSR